MHLPARARGAGTLLEIGTLAGYSAIWLPRALPPDGRLITFEADPAHVEVALANIARAGLSAVVELRVGPALESLAQLVAEGRLSSSSSTPTRGAIPSSCAGRSSSRARAA